MSADYLALQSELSKPAYASLSNDAAAAALNAALTIPNDHPIPVAAIQQAAMDRGRLFAIEQAAQGGNSYATIVVYLWSRARQDFAAVRADYPLFISILDGLKAANLIDQGDEDYILALAARQSTIAQEIPGWNLPVSADDVAHARSL